MILMLPARNISGAINFQVFSGTVDKLMVFFWVSRPCGKCVFRRFGGTSCLQLQDDLIEVKWMTKWLDRNMSVGYIGKLGISGTFDPYNGRSWNSLPKAPSKSILSTFHGSDW
jgi:hypothetical protein